MTLRPLHDRVVVRRIEAVQQTPGGILIPDAAAEKPDQGEVIAVGDGRRLENGALVPMALSTGDRVLFGKYSGQTVKLKEEEFLILREEDILGVVKGAA